MRPRAGDGAFIRGGRSVSASPYAWHQILGEGGIQRWAFYIPAVFMTVFLAIPMALTVVWSVFERTQFWMEPGFTLFAYETFFTSARAENYLFSMIHAAIAVVISFAIGFPIAVFVGRRVPRVAQHRVVLLFILPFMISELVRVFALRPVLGRNGLINSVLMEIGIISEPITIILFSPVGVVIGDVLSFLPFMVFAGFLAMEAVQRYVFEVCEDLGARTVRANNRVGPNRQDPKEADQHDGAGGCSIEAERVVPHGCVGHTTPLLGRPSPDLCLPFSTARPAGRRRAGSPLARRAGQDLPPVRRDYHLRPRRAASPEGSLHNGRLRDVVELREILGKVCVSVAKHAEQIGSWTVGMRFPGIEQLVHDLHATDHLAERGHLLRIEHGIVGQG